MQDWENGCTFASELEKTGLMKNKIILLSLAFMVAGQAFAQQQDVMRQTVAYLASQELGGRYPATMGDTLASEFIAGKLRGLKLK